MNSDHQVDTDRSIEQANRVSWLEKYKEFERAVAVNMKMPEEAEREAENVRLAAVERELLNHPDAPKSAEVDPIEEAKHEIAALCLTQDLPHTVVKWCEDGCPLNNVPPVENTAFEHAVKELHFWLNRVEGRQSQTNGDEASVTDRPPAKTQAFITQEVIETELSNGIETCPAVPLSDLQNGIVRTLLIREASDSEHRLTRGEIATELGEEPRRSFEQAVADLKAKHSFTDSKVGANGGVWLTASGIEHARKLN